MARIEERKAVAKLAVVEKKHSLGLSRPKRTTHLSRKSTSRMSHDVNELNKKILQYVNSQ